MSSLVNCSSHGQKGAAMATAFPYLPSAATFPFPVNSFKRSCQIGIQATAAKRIVRNEELRCFTPLRRFSSSRCKCKSRAKAEMREHHVSRTALIWRAIKLPIYSVAVIPLTVGTAAAFMQNQALNIGRYLVLLFSSVLIIAWLNLSNDVYDFDTGADKDKLESVVNISGRRNVVMYAAYACLVTGSMGLIRASVLAGDARVAILLLCAVLCGYMYQSPPFRLSYQGLGEPLCFLAFGPLATTAFYFSQASNSETGFLTLSNTVLSLSILVGLTTTLILFCSHFHQIDGDRAVGKLSPLVRLGTQRGYQIVKYSIATLYFLPWVFTASGSIPLLCSLFCLLTLPVANTLVEFVRSNHNNKEKIFMAKYYCVRLHISFGVALTLGLVFAKFSLRY